jgi:hypothetical protein
MSEPLIQLGMIPVDRPKRSIYIGIDPGASTGIGVWHHDEQRICDVRTLDFWRTVDYVVTTYPPDVALLVIEDPNLNPFMYERAMKDGSSMAALLKRAQNVGENKREASLLIKRFRELGYAVETFKPTKKKWTEPYFRQITGYTGRTSEHSRDALSFVYGR